jgi:hypothetical protein
MYDVFVQPWGKLVTAWGVYLVELTSISESDMTSTAGNLSLEAIVNESTTSPPEALPCTPFQSCAVIA